MSLEANEMFGTTMYDDINLSRHTTWHTVLDGNGTFMSHSLPNFGRLVSTWRMRHSKCDQRISFDYTIQCFLCRMTTSLDMFLFLLYSREQLIAFIWNCLLFPETRKIRETFFSFFFHSVVRAFLGPLLLLLAATRFTTATNINLLDKFGLITEKSYAVVFIIAIVGVANPRDFIRNAKFIGLEHLPFSPFAAFRSASLRLPLPNVIARDDCVWHT